MASYKLSLGPQVIEMLVPHRRPFLMVDRIVSFSSDAVPSLRAIKQISANEQFFDGHFPDIALMPGAMTFEGMGQTANLLSVILALKERLSRDKMSEADMMGAFTNVEYGYTLHPAFKAAKAEEFKKAVERHKGSLYGMAGAVNLKFLEPIFPGNTVEFEAALTGELDNYAHFQVEASVNGRIKAKGKISSIKGLGVGAVK